MISRRRLSTPPSSASSSSSGSYHATLNPRRKYGKINHIVNNGQLTINLINLPSTYPPPHLPAGFTFDKMLHTTPDDAFDIIMKIHVRAPFRLIRQAAPYFRVKVSSPAFLSTYSIYLTQQPEARENRSIVNVSSTSGLHGNVGQANYAAAKAAVIGLSKTLAKEWGPFGVRTNTVAFGLIHTRFVPFDLGPSLDSPPPPRSFQVDCPERSGQCYRD